MTHSVIQSRNSFSPQIPTTQQNKAAASLLLPSSVPLWSAAMTSWEAPGMLLSAAAIKTSETERPWRLRTTESRLLDWRRKRKNRTIYLVGISNFNSSMETFTATPAFTHWYHQYILLGLQQIIITGITVNDIPSFVTAKQDYTKVITPNFVKFQPHLTTKILSWEFKVVLLLIYTATVTVPEDATKASQFLLI